MTRRTTYHLMVGQLVTSQFYNQSQVDEDRRVKEVKEVKF